MSTETSDIIANVMLVVGLAVLISIPIVIAASLRFVFRNTSRRLIAIITALPIGIPVIVREPYPPYDWASVDYKTMIIMKALCITIASLIYFGIPYLLAGAGISWTDLRIRKKSQHAPPVQASPH